MVTEKHPFKPFLPQGARILFLGSFPPPPQRWSMPFFYPNWINDFWRIMGLIHFGDRNHFCLTGDKRFDEPAIRKFSAQAGLAFFDTASEVKRLKDNASDAFLEVVTPVDIRGLLRQIPFCTEVVTTGEKATRVAAEQFGCGLPPVGGWLELEVEEKGNGGDAGDNPRYIRFWRMPSTSRAYPLPLERKAEAYLRLFEP